MKKHVLLAGLMGIAAVSMAFPVIDNGNTNTLSVSGTLSQNLVVGDTVPDNTFIINPGVLIEGPSAYIGNKTSSSGNRMELREGVYAQWNNEFVVGNLSAGNVFRVNARATNQTQVAFIGADETADANRAVVAGNGARWAVGTRLSVGFQGSENMLDVSDGAYVSANDVFVGVGSSAHENSVVVSNAALTAEEMIVVGDSGSSNAIDVIDGGIVMAEDAWVGFGSNANYNAIHVSDSGSAMTLGGDLYVGTVSNSMNSVVVTNGGTISINELVVEGTNSFELSKGGTLVAYGSNFNASAEGFNWNAGGALIVHGDLTGVSALESNKTLGVYGTWDEGGAFAIGATTSGNSLDVRGQATIGALSLGTGSNSVDNALTVSGSVSELIVDSISLGHAANSNNSVKVTSGGRVVLGAANGLTIEGDNEFRFENGGWLIASNTFTAPVNGLVFGEGGIFQGYSTVSGITNVLDGNRTVLLTGGSWDVGPSTLVVGGTNGAGMVEVTDGGLLTTAGAEMGHVSGADGSRILIDDGSWDNTGTLALGAMGSINLIMVTNGGSIGTDDLEVGDQGSSNKIFATGSGVTIDVAGDATIGGTGHGNAIILEDGAFLGVGNDLLITGSGNSVSLSDDSSLAVSQTITLSGGAELEVGGDATVSAVDYYQDGQSALEFESATALTPVIDVVVGTATFESNATVRFTGLAGDVAVGVTNSRQIVESTTLNADLNALNAVAENGLFSIEMSRTGGDLFMQLIRQGLADSAGFETNSQMWNISNDIDALATGGDQNANNQLEILGNLSSGADGQQNAQLTQLYERNVPTYMHMEGLFEGMNQVQNRGILPDDYWPVGVYGPHFPGNQAQLWLKGFGSWGQRDDDGEFSGFDQSVYGVVIGYDKAFRDLLFGLAGGYSSSGVQQDDGDESDASMGYGILYSSYGSKSWFADLSIAYGMGSVENTTGTDFDTSAEFDASQFAFYIGGGKEFIFRQDTLFVTPTAAFRAGDWQQDAYTEKSSNSVVKNVDEWSRWSFKTELGVETVFRKELNNSILMPEVRAKWLHEFLTDSDTVGYALAGGTDNYSFGMIAPVSDMLELGAGLSLWVENTQGTVYEYAIGYDARIGSGYMANVLNARVNIEF